MFSDNEFVGMPFEKNGTFKAFKNTPYMQDYMVINYYFH